MLRHAVGVNLKYEKDEPRVKEFFKAAKQMLATIPQVQAYTHYVVRNPECGYQYGFVLDFESEETWLQYCEHPNNLKFSEEYWDRDVADYLFFNLAPLEEG